MAHSRDTAQQVHKEYVDTMGKIYYSYFKDYHSKLMKLQVGGALITQTICLALRLPNRGLTEWEGGLSFSYQCVSTHFVSSLKTQLTKMT